VASISHPTGWFAGLELPLKNWMVKLNGPARDLSNIWQYSLSPLLGFATAWITITSAAGTAWPYSFSQQFSNF